MTDLYSAFRSEDTEALERRALRSASTDRLEVPYFKLSTTNSQAFPVAT